MSGNYSLYDGTRTKFCKFINRSINVSISSSNSNTMNYVHLTKLLNNASKGLRVGSSFKSHSKGVKVRWFKIKESIFTTTMMKSVLIPKVTFLYNVPAVTASDRSDTNRLLYTYIYMTSQLYNNSHPRVPMYILH